MKNKNRERLRCLMRQYHRSHPWRLENGLYTPHVFPKSRGFSCWDDVGFILNGRRILIWWIHPRMAYLDAIENMAWKEAGDPPPRIELRDKQWKKVGRSRKKVMSYICRAVPDSKRDDYYARLKAIQERMETEGIDWMVRPSISVEPLSWGTGVALCAPIEVLTYEDARTLVLLAKRLLKGETTLAEEFPGYGYGRADWLAEAGLRAE